MNACIFRNASIQAKDTALAYIFSVNEKRIRLSVYAVLSANFVSEPSREEVDIFKIIPVGIFRLVCGGSVFVAMSKLLCHWISRNAVEFVPKMVREALTNSRGDTFGTSFAIKMLFTSRAFCDGHHYSSGYWPSALPSFIGLHCTSQHGVMGQIDSPVASWFLLPQHISCPWADWLLLSLFCTWVSVLSLLTQLLSLPCSSGLCLMSLTVSNLVMTRTQSVLESHCAQRCR